MTSYASPGETSKALTKRFKVFIKMIGDPTTKPCRVFNPISQKQMEELILIRDVSRYLQEKKDNELNIEHVEVKETEVEQEECTETQEEEPAE